MLSRRQRWILLLTVPLFVHAGSAQAGVTKGRIEGVVRDVQTDAPVEGAKLVLHCDCLPAPRELATATDGAYAFTGLPAGSFKLDVTFDDSGKVYPVRLGTSKRVRFDVGMSLESMSVRVRTSTATDAADDESATARSSRRERAEALAEHR